MATSSGCENPPALKNGDSYEKWLKELAIWQLYTGLDEKKQGPALTLSLTGKARDCVLELSVDDIGAEGGVKKIIDQLDKLFLKDKFKMLTLLMKLLSHSRGHQKCLSLNISMSLKGSIIKLNSMIWVYFHVC